MLGTLLKKVPPPARAVLALYCLRYKFLTSIGLKIAITCERRDLLCQGGSAALKLISEPEKSITGHQSPI